MQYHVKQSHMSQFQLDMSKHVADKCGKLHIIYILGSQRGITPSKVDAKWRQSNFVHTTDADAELTLAPRTYLSWLAYSFTTKKSVTTSIRVKNVSSIKWPQMTVWGRSNTSPRYGECSLQLPWQCEEVINLMYSVSVTSKVGVHDLLYDLHLRYMWWSMCSCKFHGGIM